MATAATRAGLPPVRPHLLRHSCGYYISPTGATICVSSRITWATPPPGPPSTIPGLPPAGSTGSGDVDRMASNRTVTLRNVATLGPERLASILVDLAEADAE